MDQTWFYTLSTIVQGLAALFSLSATFLVFKLQSLNKEIREAREIAVKTLAIIDRTSFSEYADVSISDLAKTFSESCKKLDPKAEHLGLDDYGEKELWRLERDTVHAIYGDKDRPWGEHLCASVQDRSFVLTHKVAYRVNLETAALSTGITIVITILIAVNLLAGFVPNFQLGGEPFNLNLFGLAVVLTNISVLGVLGTAIYVLVGDHY